MLERFGDRLVAFHLHDNDGSEDQHLIPGEGKIDWRRVVAGLRAAGYSGPLTMEVCDQFSGCDDSGARAFLERAARAARWLCEL